MATDVELLGLAEAGIRQYLTTQREQGRITGGYYETAVGKTLPNLRKWLLAAELDEISPYLREGLRDAIRRQQWEDLTNAYSRDVSFGTGGIREKMGARRDQVLLLKEKGVHAPIIKGPNTINDVTLLLTSAGVARFGLARRPQLKSVVIGFDSRVRGMDFARLIARLFLGYGYTVYLFDEACLYPSVTFAVPTLKADIGIFISASHNDFRYNGFKLSCQNGSQFDPAERNVLYKEFITQVQFKDIKLIPLEKAGSDQLWFLGGEPKKGTEARRHGGTNGLASTEQRSDERAKEPVAGVEANEAASRGRQPARMGEAPSTQLKDDTARNDLPVPKAWPVGISLAGPLPEAPRGHYAGREDRILDLHTLHADHIKKFLLRPEMMARPKRPLSIGYCAFNGSGRKLVPRLLSEIGIQDVKRIMALDPLDGMFPAFCSDPGREQQPDPGDWRAADIAVRAFKGEYGKAWDSVDLIIGTDPDADRCGTIIKVPPQQRAAYPHPGRHVAEEGVEATKRRSDDGNWHKETGVGSDEGVRVGSSGDRSEAPRLSDPVHASSRSRGTNAHDQTDYTLLSADDLWSLILWYRLGFEIERYGRVQDAEKKFITLSHTTTDMLCRIARKFGLGVMKTWVGFAQLAAGTRAIWDLHQGLDTDGLTEGGRLPHYDEGRRRPDETVCNRTIHSWESMDDRRRCFNVAALEQSNGFSALGGVPPDDRSLGAGGHVRDKDGTFAAMLVAELAQFAKDQETTILDLFDQKLCLDPEIGLFVTHYEPDPIDGEYEGLAGYTKKRQILDKAAELFAACKQSALTLGGLATNGATVYCTGKYDAHNWPGFPDEGYRFYFALDQQRLSHLTIRPSGTSNALRFHVQLFGGSPTRGEVVRRKGELRAAANRIVADVRERIGAL